MPWQHFTEVVLAGRAVVHVEDIQRLVGRQHGHDACPVTNGVALDLARGGGVQGKAARQVLGRFHHGVYGLGHTGELRVPGVDVAHGRTHKGRVTHRKHRRHFRAVLDGLVRGLAVDDQRGVIATKRLVAQGDGLDGIFKFFGLPGITLYRAQVRHVLFEFVLGLVTVFEQKRLHQGELELLLDGFIPHARISPTAGVVTQVKGRRKALATSVGPVLDKIVVFEVGDAIYDRVAQPGVTDQHVFFVPVDQQAVVAPDLREQRAVFVLLQAHDGRVIFGQQSFGQRQQVAHALDPFIHLAVLEDQGNAVPDLVEGAVAKRCGVSVHEVLKRGQRQGVLRVQLDARLGDVGLQHQVLAFLFAQGQEVAVEVMKQVDQFVITAGFAGNPLQLDQAHQAIAGQGHHVFVDRIAHQWRFLFRGHNACVKIVRHRIHSIAG
ncbi:hypothetical protein ALP31_200077 [Pseudomonas amygdali pv. morsprunorum]|nr:hypothetical protein ALP31_200077 [Pseudomonas amygdali pv. morsprunorum]